VHRKVIFRLFVLRKKWSWLVTKNIVFAYEPYPLFITLQSVNNRLVYGIYFVAFCYKTEAYREAIYSVVR
jgi:hypothetical protein